MAEEEDLDAFFDEVSEVEAKAVEEKEVDQDARQSKSEETVVEDEPPAKRQKTIRPRGIVVAASTSVVMAAEEREKKEAELEAANNVSSETHPTTLGRSPYARNGLSQANSSIGPSFPATNPPASTSNSNAVANKKKVAPKVAVRTVGGKTWVDKSLEEWPDNDYRIFVGNLSNEVNDQMLFKHFERYPSLARARVVRDSKNPEKSKGYGFVSLLDPLECARALREMDQTWLSSRPIRIKRSDWKDRDFKVVKKREKKEKKQQKRMGVRN